MDRAFKVSLFGGFKKADVIKYLEELASEGKKRDAEHEREIERLQQEREKLLKKLGEVEETAANLKAALDLKRAENLRLLEENRASRSEKRQLEQCVEKLAEAKETMPYTQQKREPEAFGEEILEDLRRRLEEIIEDLNRMMLPGQADRREQAEKTVSKLSSVKDILSYVRSMDE